MHATIAHRRNQRGVAPQPALGNDRLQPLVRARQLLGPLADAQVEPGDILGAAERLRDADRRWRCGRALLKRLGSRCLLKPISENQARSKRSKCITLVQAATKSFTNFSFESAQA